MGSTTTITNGGSRYLDSNNKLSSAGAAASLKYARPQDLPSYPSVGLPPSRQNKDAHAGAAASLGWAKQKPVEIWKPDASTSASTAATIGWTRKSNPPWQPQQSASGARAAVLAAQSDLRVADQKAAVSPRPKSAGFGNSAANVAMQNDRRSLQAPPTPNRASQLNRHRSLMAATGAMASPRPRADSTPPMGPKYPDEMNAQSNALRAATHAHTASRRRRSEIPQGGATPVTNMGKERYTSHPFQPSEADQKQKEDSMHASAIAMAQQMYKVIEKREKETGEAGYAATAAHGRGRSTSLMSDEPTPMKFGNLQEAAQRLAQERLAKLHDESYKNREYLDYYGSSQPTQRRRFRRRASSDTTMGESRDIRSQAPLYSSKMSQIDAKTRQRDRDMLLAAAQRNVQRSLQGIDEQVYAQTGRPTQSMMGQETLPMAIAQQRVQQQQPLQQQPLQQQPPPQQGDKIAIGSGALVDRSSVDALAFRNVQPVLHQIHDKSEAEQARKLEIKLDEEEAKRQIEREREREEEFKEIDRQLKEHDKQEKKERKSQENFFKRQSKRWSKQSSKSSKSKSTQSRESYVPEPMAMSGAVGSGGGASGYHQVAPAEYEPPVERAPVAEPAPAVEPTPAFEPAPAVQPVQQAPVTPPVQHVRVAEPVKPAQPTFAVQPPEPIEDEDVPEIPVSEYTDKGKSSQPFSRLQKNARPSQTAQSSQLGVKTWLKTAFRRTSKGQKEEQEKQFGAGSQFVGGASYAQQSDGTPQVATKTMFGNDENEVPVSRFLTGTDGSKYSQDQEGSTAGGGLATNPVQETVAPREEEGYESEETRDQFNDADVAMPIFKSSRPLSPARDSRFKEVI